jgi:glyoxylase-like metal-dependent hydrolase (beta-lactamase superfamily II)
VEVQRLIAGQITSPAGLWRQGDSMQEPLRFPVPVYLIETVDGEHDLLGDGSIRLMPTPGHTAGHQSLWVTERLLIGGDVVHFASSLDDLRFPVFADDHAAQADSARRLRAHRDAGVTVTPGHDPAVIGPGPVLATT